MESQFWASRYFLCLIPLVLSAWNNVRNTSESVQSHIMITKTKAAIFRNQSLWDLTILATTFVMLDCSWKSEWLFTGPSPISPPSSQWYSSGLSFFLCKSKQCFCFPHPFYHLLGENQIALQSNSTLLLIKQHDLKDSSMSYCATN